MGELCMLPWAQLGFNRDMQFCCCFANFPSCCNPTAISTEIIDQDFLSNGILWKIWNSQVYQEMRGLMSNSLMQACYKSDCGSIPNITLKRGAMRTQKQINNYDKMLSEIKNKETIVDYYPIMLNMWLDGTCNMNCYHCGQQGVVRQLPISNFKEEMIDFLSNACVCTLLGGEPTICKDYDLFMSLVKEANGASVQIITNGQFIIQKVLPYLGYISDVTISVDAATPETYAKMRPGKNKAYNFDRLLFNLRHLQKHLFRSKILSGMSFIINGINYHEMPQMVDLAVEYGADYVFMGEVSRINYPQDKIETIMWTYNNPIIMSKYLDLTIQRAKEKNIHLTYNFDGTMNKAGGF
jgi:wyosine [tRNA(Phe)-imidazoG37] synthetase (radical SAM superfamily)